MEQDIRAKHLALELEYAVLSTLDQERAFLEANQSIGGESDVLLVDDLEEMRAYIVNRHEELALDRVDVNLAIEELNEEIMALTAQIGQSKSFIPAAAKGIGVGPFRAGKRIGKDQGRHRTCRVGVFL